MSTKADNALFDKIGMPDAVNGTNSRPFTVPNGAKVLTIHAPAMTGASTTMSIEKLVPQLGDQVTEVWQALSAIIIANPITFCTFTSIPEDAATTIPVAAIGSGIFRLVASAGQTGAVDNETITLSWGLDG